MRLGRPIALSIGLGLLTQAAIGCIIELQLDPPVVEKGSCATLHIQSFKEDPSGDPEKRTALPNMPFTITGDVNSGGITDSQGKAEKTILADVVLPNPIVMTVTGSGGCSAEAKLYIAVGHWEKTYRNIGNGVHHLLVYTPKREPPEGIISFLGKPWDPDKPNEARNYTCTVPFKLVGTPDAGWIMDCGDSIIEPHYPYEHGSIQTTGQTNARVEFVWVPTSINTKPPTKALINKKGFMGLLSEAHAGLDPSMDPEAPGATAIATVYNTILGIRSISSTSGVLNDPIAPVEKTVTGVVLGGKAVVAASLWGALGGSFVADDANYGSVYALTSNKFDAELISYSRCH